LEDGKDFQVKAFIKIVEEIRDTYFNQEFDIKKAEKFQFFQEKSGITKLANQIGKELLEKYQSQKEDILV